LSHPRILFNNDNGDFEIEIKHNDNVPFNVIYKLEINNDPKEFKLEVDATLQYDIQTRIKDIVLTKYNIAPTVLITN